MVTCTPSRPRSPGSRWPGATSCAPARVVVGGMEVFEPSAAYNKAALARLGSGGRPDAAIQIQA